MSNFEKITVTCNDSFDVTFAIDHSKITNEQWHQINSFWGDADYRLDEAKGNVVKAVLVMLAQQCMQIQVSNNFNSRGVMCAFNWDDGEGVEGWPKMDGSKGILIQHCQPFEFEVDPDVDVSCKPIDKMPDLPQANW
jgi:hypothetical protein